MYGYVYKIGWTEYDRWYVGERHKEGCKFSDLWNTYYTSSESVKQFAMHFGKPDVIELICEVEGTYKQTHPYSSFRRVLGQSLETN